MVSPRVAAEVAVIGGLCQAGEDATQLGIETGITQRVVLET